MEVLHEFKKKVLLDVNLAIVGSIDEQITGML